MKTRTLVSHTLLLLVFIGAISACAWAFFGYRYNPAATVVIDVAANRRAIDPRIYGVNWASTEQLLDLNSPVNRQGGNATSRYNWRLNASNRGRDWYYQSTPIPDDTPGEFGDSFVRDTFAANAEPMLTIPMLPWIAKLGEGRGKLASFSIEKYGPQTDSDNEWFPDAGNGIKLSGDYVVGNDPNDANMPSDSGFQKGWVEHLVETWGSADKGGVRYYILDNEPSVWHGTHRDVHPIGATMKEIRDAVLDYGAVVKAVDPSALVVAPEELSWTSLFRSGYDQQWGEKHGWQGPFPDRSKHDGWLYLPWLLDQFRQAELRSGKRLVDVFSIHYYPKGGDSSDDLSIEMQELRNRSTRSLWDPDYFDESWVEDYVQLIPRLKSWVDAYYPGTQIAITEYHWGAENHISGATAQADVLGIFGREGLDMAMRWEAPAIGSPVYNAMKLYRNYDGKKSTFGDISVSATVANPDEVSAFAAERSSDGAVTVILISKYLSGHTKTSVDLRNADVSQDVQYWQLTSDNKIARYNDLPVLGNSVNLTLPPQSITLLVFGDRSG